MKHRLFTAAAFVALAVAGRADVTLSYSWQVKPGPMIPPQAVEAMKSQMAAMKMVTVLKGNKAYAEMMGMTAITNFDGALITVLDSKNKRYASASQQEYAAATAKQFEIPAEARKALESMKMDIKTRATGQTRTIQGIRTEQRDIEITMEVPAGPQGSMQMRAVQSLWVPDQDAFVNNAALQELARYYDRAWLGLNPSDLMGKMFSQMPAFAEKLKSITSEMKTMKVMLGSRMAMYMPGMAAMLEQLRKAGKPVPAGMDPNAPTMEMIMDLQELSTAEIPDSRFEVPKDYTMAPLAEVLQSVMPKPAGMPGHQH